MRIPQRALVLLSLISSAGGCSSAPSLPDPIQAFRTAPDRDQSSTTYIIDAPDQIKLTSNLKEFDGQTCSVRHDGKIGLPLLGDVEVAGQTPAQVRDVISRRAAQFYKSPDVQIDVIANSKFFSISTYAWTRKVPYTGNNSVLKVLADADRMGEKWTSTVTLVRPRHGNTPPCMVTIDIRHMADTGDRLQDFILEEGDIISFTEGPYPFQFGKIGTKPFPAPDNVRPGINPLLPLR